MRKVLFVLMMLMIGGRVFAQNLDFNPGIKFKGVMFKTLELKEEGGVRYQYAEGIFKVKITKKQKAYMNKSGWIYQGFQLKDARGFHYIFRRVYN